MSFLINTCSILLSDVMQLNWFLLLKILFVYQYSNSLYPALCRFCFYVDFDKNDYATSIQIVNDCFAQKLLLICFNKSVLSQSILYSVYSKSDRNLLPFFFFFFLNLEQNMSTNQKWLFALNLLIFFQKKFLNFDKWGKWLLDLIFFPKITKFMGITPKFHFFQ